MTVKMLWIFFLICIPKITSIERSLYIATASGPVKGKLNEFNGFEYYSYEGIPYAENPTGKLRFRAPVPRKPWTDVLDATEEGAICSQIDSAHRTKDTTEDCLNVNVYVPANETDKLLPVVVYVHGGALQYLSGNIADGHGPQRFLEREIIFVTMNYRLGPFGFLSLGIEEASGNAGIKDVLLSLKWVKHNIEKFGGDPDKITAAGHSAGSLIINYLMLTNESEGLFNQAILLSGSAFTPRSFAKHPKDIAFRLAEELSIETHDVYEILELLQDLDAKDILNAYKNMSKSHDSPIRRYAPFVPTKEVKYEYALFTDDPIEVFRKSDRIARNIPVIVGITSLEALQNIPHVLNKIDGVNKLREQPENLIPSNIEYPIESQRSKDLARLICEIYFGGEGLKKFTLTTLLEFITDTQYIYGVNYWVKKYQNMVRSKPLFFYIFDFIGDLNTRKKYFKSNVIGSGHGDDLLYFFITDASKSNNSIDERSQLMVNRMVSFIANFVYYGNPTLKGASNELKWLDYGKDQNYLLLNDNASVEKFNSSLLYARMQFWEKVYEEYYDYLDKGGEIEKKIIP